MRAAVTAVAGAAILAATTSAGPFQSTATLVSSTTKPGARPVALTFRLRYLMQCGSPGTGPLVLDFPAQMSLPARIAPSDVLLDGKPAPGVTRAPREVLVVSLPQQPAIMCDVIAMGTLTVTVTKGAGLANPAPAGVYAVPVQSDRVAAIAHLHVG